MSFTNIIGYVIHADEHIETLLQSLGPLAYIVLFLIIFFETGVVVAPFLPGDSLIFIVGAIAASSALNILLLLLLLSTAAILGDTLNYWIGNYFGKKIEKKNLVKKDYLIKTENFYHKHGKKTIVLARFIPIIRTFAPFVAGIGKMHYPTFLFYNITGGIAWVAIFLFAGYYFGAIPIIKENLTLIVLVIIILSFIPPIIEYIKHKKRANQ